MTSPRKPLGTLTPNTVASSSTAKVATQSDANRPEKPSKKRKSTSTTGASSSISVDGSPEASPTNPQPSKKPRTSTSSQPTASSLTYADPAILDVSMVVRDINSDSEQDLHDFSTNRLPVFDTCDTIRRKIRALLRPSANKPVITQAAFLRAISKATYGPDTTKTITPATRSAFLKKKGPLEGNTSMVYYASYVFFEKLRIKQGKPKSDDREIMEDIWAGKGGIDTKKISSRVQYITVARVGGGGFYYDEFGCPRFM
ncbi:hypothetical protein V8F20_007939 [Naviculisporaceae sp. PSN 640]